MYLTDEKPTQTRGEDAAVIRTPLKSIVASYAQNRISILAVIPDEKDRCCLRAILGHSNWSFFTTGTIADAVDFLKHNTVGVILCERDLPDGSWENLLQALTVHSPMPHLVVTSCFADDYLWSAVLNLGGYDVLPKPWAATEVLRVLALAWHNWHDQVRVMQACC